MISVYGKKFRVTENPRKPGFTLSGQRLLDLDIDIDPKPGEPLLFKRKIPKKLDPVIIPEKNKGENMDTKTPAQSLTWKAILFVCVMAIARAVLAIWFDDATTEKFIIAIKNVLEALGITGVGIALWGIRRANGDIV